MNAINWQEIAKNQTVKLITDGRNYLAEGIELKTVLNMLKNETTISFKHYE